MMIDKVELTLEPPPDERPPEDRPLEERPPYE